MSVLKILVVEGCSNDILEKLEQNGEAFGSHHYRDALLLNSSDVEIDIAYPYASFRNQDLLPFESYDGFALTGSSVPWGAEAPEAKPYISFIEKLLTTGKPVLGSCWGMQTVAVLLGGMSGPNPKGTEIGVSRNISLNEAGKIHPLFAGMPEVFDSPCWHRDHVTQLPTGAVLLASNSVSDVQAMAYNQDGMDYMGFQFHPETPLEVFRESHAFRTVLPGTIQELVDFPEDIPAEISDPMLRTKPLSNWLTHVRNRKHEMLAAAE